MLRMPKINANGRSSIFTHQRTLNSYRRNIYAQPNKWQTRPLSVLIPQVIEERNNTATAYDIYSRLLKERVICLMGPINDVLTSSVVAQLIYLEHLSDTEPIHMYINSPGGEVYSGMSVYDTMQYIKAPVYTIALGHAMSMASVILAAGEPGHRFALPHTNIMIHQPMGGREGQASDIAIAAKEILRIRASIVDIYKRHSTAELSTDDIDKLIERDNYLVPADALRLGLIDQIIERKLPDIEPRSSESKKEERTDK